MFGDEWVTRSFSEDSDLLIDDFNNGDIEKGPMETPVAVTGFDVVDELLLAGSFSPDPRLSYHEEGLYLESSVADGSIAHDMSSWDPSPLDVSGFRYLSFRAANLGSFGSAQLAVNMNGDGSSAVSTDGLVRIPAPYAHQPLDLWAILGTVRIPLACIEAANPEADRSEVQSIFLQSRGLDALVIDALAFQN
jgi:hypothetical protein